jgi:hypothetical protein
MAWLRRGALATAALVSAIGIALPCPAALGGEMANAGTVLGETGLFTLLSGDTLPRDGWSFGLYYNNWDRVIPPGGPDPGDPGRDYSDPAYDPLTALFSGPAGSTDRWDFTIRMPYEDVDTPDPNDLFDVGHFPTGDTVTRDFFVEVFKPAGATGPQPAWSPSDAAEPELSVDWNRLSAELGYGLFSADHMDVNVSNWGRSRFDLDRNGRRDDIALGQALIEGEPADVLVPRAVRAQSAARAGASRLSFLPICSRGVLRLRGVFRGILMFDRQTGSAASRNFRRHVGGTIATNALISRTPTFGPGGRLSFEFAGCGRGHVEVFSTFHALGLPRIVRGLRRDVAATLVDLRLDGRPVRHSVEVETARERSVKASSLWPNPPRGNRRDQIGLLLTVRGRFDRALVGSAAKSRRLTLAPRRGPVGFVSRCLRRNGSPRLVRAGRRTALACRRG